MAQIILLSGGMDSLISHRLFYPDAQPVFVGGLSRYAEHDYFCAMQQVPLVSYIEAPKMVERADGVVPHRNALMLALVANMFHAAEIIVSAPKGELIWDQQTAFYYTMEQALKVQINNPLERLTKTQAVAAWLHRGLPAEELLASRSCYSRSEHQCGQCPACVKRWIALKNNGLSEYYHSDVRQYAMTLATLGTWRDALRYGARPTWEAWKALQ